LPGSANPELRQVLLLQTYYVHYTLFEE
jgi:hypothetical protein